MKANWSLPTAIRFGAGRLAELPALLADKDIANPLVVSDPGLAAIPAMLPRLTALLDEAGIPHGVFTAIKPNPTGANIEHGVAVYHSGNHDGVIAFGGGSALDAGKAIAFMQGQKRPLWDFEDIGDWWTRADPAGIAPVIAIPTTAGTGSEVGRAAVVTDEKKGEKKIIFHPKMLPAAVIEDAELLAGLPARLKAATGMDALAHALEAYCAPGFHPIADGAAVEALRLIKDNLAGAVAGRAECDAAMMAAASLGAISFQKGLGAVHALSHPLGAVYDTHHGTLNAILMTPVLDFNRPAVEERMTRLAAWLELEEPGFDGVRGWVARLRSEIGLPDRLGAVGIDAARLDEILEKALRDPSCGGNPVPLDRAGLEEIFRAAL
jgi:alcohol dehydrogenase class IV